MKFIKYIKYNIAGIIIFMIAAGLCMNSCQKQIDPGNWDIHWPIIDFTINPTTALVGDTVFFQAVTKLGSSNVTSWKWTFGDSTGATATGTDPSFIFNQKGTYHVSLLGTDSAGNSDYISKTLTVVEDTGMRLRVMICAALTSSYTEANYQKLASIINTYDPDLVLIREIDSATRRSGHIDVPAYIAERVGMHHYFGMSFAYKGGGYGNALLSRFPIVDSNTFSLLPTPFAANQVASLPVITVKINYRGTHLLTFAGTELYAKSSAATRLGQVDEILPHLPQDTAAILAGDFSDIDYPRGDISGSPIFSFIIQQNKFSLGCMATGCPVNNPVGDPKNPYDYVFFRPSDQFILVKSTAVNETIAKGFLPIIVDLRYKPDK